VLTFCTRKIAKTAHVFFKAEVVDYPYCIHLGYVEGENAVLENGATVEQVIKVKNL
jgi:hypothetical protein